MLLQKKNNIGIPNCNIDNLKVTLEFYGFTIAPYDQILQTTYNKHTFTFVVLNNIMECRFYDKLGMSIRALL
jgi:hypothetical protein